MDLAVKAAKPDDEGVVTLGGMFSDAFNLYAGMERSARRMITFQQLVPGLLQTPGYARGLIESFLGDGSTEDIEQRVRTRLKRQVMVTRKYCPLQLDVLLHESATRHVIGSPEIMAAQMRQLAEVSKRRERHGGHYQSSGPLSVRGRHPAIVVTVLRSRADGDRSAIPAGYRRNQRVSLRLRGYRPNHRFGYPAVTALSISRCRASPGGNLKR